MCYNQYVLYVISVDICHIYGCMCAMYIFMCVSMHYSVIIVLLHVCPWGVVIGALSSTYNTLGPMYFFTIQSLYMAKKMSSNIVVKPV